MLLSTSARSSARAIVGHYTWNLHTSSGNVTLKVPKLKGRPFETAIIERYRRRKSSVEEDLIEMYLAGVSVRRVEDIVFGQADFPIFVVGIPHRHRGKIPTFSGPCQEAGSTTASCRMRACSIR